MTEPTDSGVVLRYVEALEAMTEVILTLQARVRELQVARIGDAEVIGRWMCQAEAAEAARAAAETMIRAHEQSIDNLKIQLAEKDAARAAAEQERDEALAKSAIDQAQHDALLAQSVELAARLTALEAENRKLRTVLRSVYYDRFRGIGWGQNDAMAEAERAAAALASPSAPTSANIAEALRVLGDHDMHEEADKLRRRASAPTEEPEMRETPAHKERLIGEGQTRVLPSGAILTEYPINLEALSKVNPFACQRCEELESALLAARAEGQAEVRARVQAVSARLRAAADAVDRHGIDLPASQVVDLLGRAAMSRYWADQIDAAALPVEGQKESK